jgi:hypothetical protein
MYRLKEMVAEKWENSVIIWLRNAEIRTEL